jgi:hypothetical protein
MSGTGMARYSSPPPEKRTSRPQCADRSVRRFRADQPHCAVSAVGNHHLCPVRVEPASGASRAIDARRSTEPSPKPYVTTRGVCRCQEWAWPVTEGIDVPTQPSSQKTRPPSMRLKTLVEQASQRRVGLRVLEEASGRIAELGGRLDGAVHSVQGFMAQLADKDAVDVHILSDLEGRPSRQVVNEIAL